VFPEILIFHPPETGDTILVASRQPLVLDLAALERRWEEPAVRADLARVGLERPEHLLACLVLGPEGVRALAARGHVNTDDNMYVEFRGPRDMERGMFESANALFTEFARHATPVENLVADAADLLGSRDRLAALIAGLTRAERETTHYEEMLASLPVEGAPDEAPAAPPRVPAPRGGRRR
jgi:hypothetical protein